MTSSSSSNRMRMRMRVLALVAPLALIACLGKTTSLGSAENSNEGDPSGSGSGVTNGAKPGDSTTSSSSSSGSPSGSSSGSSGSIKSDSGVDAGNGSGIACQIGSPSLPIAPCPTGEYCKADPNGTCSYGHCVTKPPPPPPFCAGMECGCDGVVRCTDNSRPGGIDIDPTGGQCGVACGTQTCNGVTDYCEHNPGGCGIATFDGGCGGGIPETFTCKPIPSACSINHTCLCMSQNTGTFGSCTDTDGRIRMDLPPPP